MTQEQLIEILSRKPEEAVSALQKSSYVIPKWSDLEKQYDPMKHSIWDETKYPKKTNDNNTDDFKRTSLALQKLAVNRIAQSMFSTPVQRIYDYDRENEKQQKAVDLLEEIYKTQNYIDSENIERAKQLNAACQIVTIWKAIEKQNTVQEEIAKYKLKHRTYSEMDGYKIYPIIDENDELLVVSVLYKDSDDIEHFLVYTDTDTPAFYLFDNDGGWALNVERSKPLEIFPVIYANIKEPVWGGSAGTNLVEQLEEMESYQGLYIKRNALPTFTLDYGDITGQIKINTDESSNNSRHIIKVGKGGGLNDVTWKGAGDAVNARYDRIRNAFFEQIQVPDTSFANMIKSNTSAENKELIFADAKAKARDLGGEWERLFYDELLIVKEFAKIIFPSYAADFDAISVRSVIKPYSIRTKKENAEYVATGGQSMSLETQVRILGEVDDVMQEVEAIQDERGVESNQLL